MARLTLSAATHDFGPNVPGNNLVQTVATVSNLGTAEATLAPSLSGDATFALQSGGSGTCGTTLAPSATCDLRVAYTPAGAPARNSAVLQLGASGPDASRLAVNISGDGVALATGTVTATANPYVAQYTLTAPAPGTWSVSFGPTSSYGRTTSIQTGTAGATASVYVAGMQAGSANHMRATFTFANGVVVNDGDHAFTAGAALPGVPESFPVTVQGMPQPGIELIDPVNGPVPSTAIATDLAGNVIWAYPFADADANARIAPVKLLDNGHMLAMAAPLSYPLGIVSRINALREFDLVGNVVRELTVDTLNMELAAAGFSLKADVYSHDFASLPNGHTLVIVSTEKMFTDLQDLPGETEVAADAVVDLDANWKPVWVWNEFDHFDINRRPFLFPDWTHTNSIAYSADDGSFIVSIRHQNWIVKVNYKNGSGDGSIVWKLGEGGDFRLVNGMDPTDWFYAQHDAQFTGSKTAGVFRMTVMDNGDDRIVPAGGGCGLPTTESCVYSTVQELEVDETAMTATLLFHQILPAPNEYSFFGGNTEILTNGNFEYTLSGVPAGATIFEVTPGTTLGSAPAAVWQMLLPDINIYRGFRLPSLYPGVQWTK